MLTSEPQAAGLADEAGDPEVETQGTAQDEGDSDPSGETSSDPVADLVEQFSETAKPEGDDDQAGDQAEPDDDKSKDEQQKPEGDKKDDAEKPKEESPKDPVDLTPEERKTIGKKASKKFDSLLADRKADREALAKVSEIAKTADPFLKHAEEVGLITRDEDGKPKTAALRTWVDLFGQIDKDQSGAAKRLRGIADKIDPSGAIKEQPPLELTPQAKAAIEAAEALGEDMAPVRALFEKKAIPKPEPEAKPDPEPKQDPRVEQQRRMDEAYDRLEKAVDELAKKHPIDWPKIKDDVGRRVGAQSAEFQIPPEKWPLLLKKVAEEELARRAGESKRPTPSIHPVRSSGKAPEKMKITADAVEDIINAI